MFKFRFLPILLLPACLMAIPYETMTIKEGVGTPIKSGQLIKVQYKGWLTDSTLFDDSYARGEPLEFSLGAGQVIAGWDRGLVGMKVGEIRKLSLPYELAYGDRAIGPIPAKSDLLFEVELIAAQEPLLPDAFPKDLKTMKWQRIDPGVSFVDEKQGEGTAAMPGTKIKLHYSGWISQGRKFASSKDLGKPLEVVLGANKLIKGWETGLEGLKPGAIRWLRVSPAMGYGSKAYSAIPPNSTLIFRIEIISVETDEVLAESMDFFPDLATLSLQEGKEGLQYAIIKPGEGEPAKMGDKVRVHYTGFLSDGTKFDSSRDRGQIFDFPLGGGRVIRGWDLGVEGMLPGEKRVLVIPPGIGYGSRGGGPIPPDATLIFVVEYMGE